MERTIFPFLAAAMAVVLGSASVLASGAAGTPAAGADGPHAWQPREAGRIRFAVCQMATRTGEIAENARRGLAWAEKAADGGADAVVFPEFSFVSYPDLLRGAEVPDFDEAEWGLAAFGDFARRRGCWVFVNHPERADGARYNEMRVLGPDGRVAATYRKCTLALVDACLGMHPGEGGVVADLPFGRVGLLVCKDASEPEPFQAAYAAADVLVVQFAHVVRGGRDVRGGRRDVRRNPFVRFPEPLDGIVSGCREAFAKPLVVASKPGAEGPWPLAGGSRVVDAEGRAVASAGEGECLLVADFPCGPDGRIAGAPESPPDATGALPSDGLPDHTGK
ncbi:MAG: carbon-nitrogen hydrolase family protein [Kiritimatiellae bacterium]|nr:carbon-nitrogen hydrolase family protein [Kiritimatiellia bacterium]